MAGSAAAAREEAERLMKEAEQMETSASTIQAGIKGRDGRKEAAELQKVVAAEEDAAAKTVQGAVRGKETRSKLDKDLDACMGAEEEDGNTVAPDINLTIEDVRNNRNDMLAAMAEYRKTGKMNKAMMMPRKFAKPKSDEDKKDAQMQRNMAMSKKRQERNRALSNASNVSEGDFDDLDSPVSGGGGGGGGGGGDAAEAAAAAASETEMLRIKQRKERAERRRSRSRSESQEAEMAGITSPSGGANGGDVPTIEEDQEYDDESLMSPTSKAMKPKANAGCVVHSIGGKWVQVNSFGSSGSPGVPNRNARAKHYS